MRVNHGAFGFSPARHRGSTPTAVMNHVEAWNRPSQTVLYFIAFRSVGNARPARSTFRCRRAAGLGSELMRVRLAS